MTETTQKARRMYRLWTLVSVLCGVGPVVGFSIAGLVNGSATYQKTALVFSIFVAIIFSGIFWLNKKAFKSRIWIIFLGLYICLDKVLAALIVFGICQIVDELLCEPMARHYKQKYTINKEFDARTPEPSKEA